MLYLYGALKRARVCRYCRNPIPAGGRAVKVMTTPPYYLCADCDRLIDSLPDEAEYFGAGREKVPENNKKLFKGQFCPFGGY